MAAVLIRVRAELRARWRTWVALTLMLGIFVGATAAAAVGARRTGSAYPRFLETTRSFDVFVADYSVFAPVFWKVDFDALERFPDVEQGARVRYFFGTRDDEILAPVDDVFGSDINRPKILEGRMPRDADEVSIPFAFDREPAVRVGQTVRIEFDGQSTQHIELKIVGRHAMPGDFPPTDLLGTSFVASRAFAERWGGRLPNTVGTFLRFGRGEASLDAFDAHLRRLSEGRVVNAFRNAEQAVNVQRSFELQANALWILVAALAIGIALVLGQTIARQTALEASDDDALLAIGMSRRQLIGAGMLRIGIVSLIAGVLAAGLSWLASPYFPRGSARIAETDPGFAFDAVVAGGALGAAMAMGLGAAAIALARRARRTKGSGSAPVRPSFLAGALARSGWSPAAVAGARFALEPGAGRTAVPVRSTTATLSLGIAALVAAFTFGAAMDHLLETPRLYGLRWHVAYGFGTDDGGVPPKAFEIVRDDPSVDAAVSGVPGLPLEVGRVGEEGRIALAGIGYEPLIGQLFADPLEGSFPGAGEVVLGPRTRERLGVRVGDRVRVAVQGASAVEMKVSGIGVLPPSSETAQFGDGILVRFGSLPLLVPEGEEVPPADSLLVRFKDDARSVEAREALRARLREAQVDEDFGLPRPHDLVNFGRVQNLPLILAGILAALAAAVLVHLLVTAIKRRSRDVAILKTLGFVRRQARMSVAWHATFTIVVALAIGVPGGLALGRALWTAFARDLGVIVEPVMPWLSVAVVVPATLALANLIALGPARAAARTRPAVVLRSE